MSRKNPSVRHRSTFNSISVLPRRELDHQWCLSPHHVHLRLPEPVTMVSCQLQVVRVDQLRQRDTNLEPRLSDTETSPGSRAEGQASRL